MFDKMQLNLQFTQRRAVIEKAVIDATNELQNPAYVAKKSPAKHNLRFRRRRVAKVKNASNT